MKYVEDIPNIMLDIRQIREQEISVRKNIARRNGQYPLAELIDADGKWRESQQEIDRLRARKNSASSEIAKVKKEGGDASALLLEIKELPAMLASQEKLHAEAQQNRDRLMMLMPNLLHESVPDGVDGTQNKVVRESGTVRNFNFAPKNHTQLLEDMGLADTEKAARAAASRFYYLKGGLLRMALALESFAIDSITSDGFLPVQTPYMLKREALASAVSLSDFEDVIYKIEGEDLYLIGTSEHSLLSMHMGDIFEEGAMPICYGGFSTNFRKEAGAHGKDQKGIFRVHQFEKIEQFVFCRPEESWDWHENLIANAEKIYKALEIPYRTVLLCSGDTGVVSSKTYDIEAHFPGAGEYREVVSASNCLDFQTRRANIRFRDKGALRFPHALNSTAVAVQRTLACILENYQNDDNTITVPGVLRPYMGGQKTIKKVA